jgi:hypothetical protein
MDKFIEYQDRADIIRVKQNEMLSLHGKKWRYSYGYAFYFSAITINELIAAFYKWICDITYYNNR